MALRPLARRVVGSVLFSRTVLGPRSLKNLSQAAEKVGVAASTTRSGLYLLAGSFAAVGAWFWLGRRRRREDGGVGVLPVARAGGSERGAEEKPKKVSGRELRYKSFASYVYKGEPYMSAHDFLESLIRDKPRCEPQ